MWKCYNCINCTKLCMCDLSFAVKSFLLKSLAKFSLTYLEKENNMQLSKTEHAHFFGMCRAGYTS